ncbi:MAG: hypothetical protein FWC72_00960 [Oscillospiraceae bacterium]|nr:hypothetical protein [Oscillospiraceae bacterium]
MKLIKRGVLLALVFIITLSITSYALNPPYSLGSGDPEELKERLVQYIDDFPSGRFGPDNQPASRACHLEQRPVFWPSVTDPNLVFRWGSFRESSWGAGINYSSFSWIVQGSLGEWPRSYIAVSIYYEYTDPLEIYRTRFMGREYTEMLTHEGIYKRYALFCPYIHNAGWTCFQHM